MRLWHKTWGVLLGAAGIGWLSDAVSVFFHYKPDKLTLVTAFVITGFVVLKWAVEEWNAQ